MKAFHRLLSVALVGLAFAMPVCRAGAGVQVTLVEPLYCALFRAPMGRLQIPDAVSKALEKANLGADVAEMVELLHRSDGTLSYRILLCDGSSTIPSKANWTGVEVGLDGTIARKWPEPPRKGPLEDE